MQSGMSSWNRFSAFLGGCAGIGICFFAAHAVAHEPAPPGLPTALEREFAQCWSGEAGGVGCETRNEPREVSRRNFVVDRVPAASEAVSGRLRNAQYDRTLRAMKDVFAR